MEKEKTLVSLVFSSLIIVGLLSSGCVSGINEDHSSNNNLSGKIFISGAFALYPMMITWSEEFQKEHPDVQFEISAGGAGKGMTDALSDMVDIGMVSRDIYPEEVDKGAVWVSVAQDAVVGTMNADNPQVENILKRGITPRDLTNIYIEKTIASWNELTGEGQNEYKIHIFTRSDACGAAATWANYFGYHQEDLSGVGVFGDPGLAEAVREDNLAIGYNNINYAYDASTKKPVDGLVIIPLDLNENGVIDPDENFYETRDELIGAIADGRYPSPPSRYLNLVTKDNFTGLTREFVTWILTEGQQYTDANGYIRLTEDKRSTELAKIES